MGNEVTTLVGTLRTLLAAIADVDQASVNEYLPPIQTAKIALIIPPFRQRTRVRLGSTNSTSGTGDTGFYYHLHRIPCEFWVKHTGNNADTWTLAREIGVEACAVLAQSSNIDLVNNEIEAEVADMPVVVGSATYFVVTVFPEIIQRYAGGTLIA
jgi:hypothetical protein